MWCNWQQLNHARFSSKLLRSHSCKPGSHQAVHFQRNSTKDCCGAETGPCRVCPEVPHTSEVSVGCCKWNKTLLNICPKPTSSFSCSSCCATLCSHHTPSVEDLLQWCCRTLGHAPVPTSSAVPSHKLLLSDKAATVISNQIHGLLTESRCSKNHHYGSRPRHETLCSAFSWHQPTSVPKWFIFYTSFSS